MRTVSWLRCDDRTKAVEVCNKLIAAGARIINVAETVHGPVVWYEHECVGDQAWLVAVFNPKRSKVFGRE